MAFWGLFGASGQQVDPPISRSPHSQCAVPVRAFRGMPVLGRRALGLLLILGSSDAFLPVPSQKGCILTPGYLSGPLGQGPVEGGKESFTCRPSRSTALASTVMDSTPSDVADVEESMPADMR